MNYNGNIMKLDNLLTDAATLKEIGQRLASKRIAENLTQEEVAKNAGVSKSTVERIESGNSTQVSNLIRVLRNFSLLEALDKLLPESENSPLEILRQKKQKKKSRARKSTKKTTNSSWEWDENS